MIKVSVDKFKDNINKHIKTLCKDWFELGVSAALLYVKKSERIFTNEEFEKVWDKLHK